MDRLAEETARVAQEQEQERREEAEREARRRLRQRQNAEAMRKREADRGQKRARERADDLKQAIKIWRALGYPPEVRKRLEELGPHHRVLLVEIDGAGIAFTNQDKADRARRVLATTSLRARWLASPRTMDIGGRDRGLGDQRKLLAVDPPDEFIRELGSRKDRDYRNRQRQAVERGARGDRQIAELRRYGVILDQLPED